MKNKRGQFFLIAALIIIVIISGFAIVQVSTRTLPENTKIVNLQDELSFEGRSVIDNGVFDGSEAENSQKLQDLISFYEERTTGDLVVVSGTPEKFTILQIEESTSGAIQIGGATQPLTSSRILPIEEGSCTSDPCIIVVEVQGTDLEFELGEGQSFFVVIGEESAQGEIAITGLYPR